MIPSGYNEFCSSGTTEKASWALPSLFGPRCHWAHVRTSFSYITEKSVSLVDWGRQLRSNFLAQCLLPQTTMGWRDYSSWTEGRKWVKVPISGHCYSSMKCRTSINSTWYSGYSYKEAWDGCTECKTFARRRNAIFWWGPLAHSFPSTREELECRELEKIEPESMLNEGIARQWASRGHCQNHSHQKTMELYCALLVIVLWTLWL